MRVRGAATSARVRESARLLELLATCRDGEPFEDVPGQFRSREPAVGRRDNSQAQDQVLCMLV